MRNKGGPVKGGPCVMKTLDPCNDGLHPSVTTLDDIGVSLAKSPPCSIGRDPHLDTPVTCGPGKRVDGVTVSGKTL